MSTRSLVTGGSGFLGMLELEELMLGLTGGDSKIVYRPLPEDDPKQRQPDIALAKSQLDWSPRVELKVGLGKTIEYFRTRI